MTKTFYMLQPGDKLYYVTFDKTRLVNKSEIKKVTVDSIERIGESYYSRIKLHDGNVISVCFNNNIHQEPITNEQQIQCQNSVATPLFCTIYSTEEQDLKEYIARIITEKISLLARLNVEIQEELIRLGGVKQLMGFLAVKKTETLVLEPVIV